MASGRARFQNYELLFDILHFFSIDYRRGVLEFKVQHFLITIGDKIFQYCTCPAG